MADQFGFGDQRLWPITGNDFLPDLPVTLPGNATETSSFRNAFPGQLLIPSETSKTIDQSDYQTWQGGIYDLAAYEDHLMPGLDEPSSTRVYLEIAQIANPAGGNYSPNQMGILLIAPNFTPANPALARWIVSPGGRIRFPEKIPQNRFYAKAWGGPVSYALIFANLGVGNG